MSMFSLGLLQWQSEYFQFLALLEFRDIFLPSGESEAPIPGPAASKYCLGHKMSDIKATKQKDSTVNECLPYLHIDNVCLILYVNRENTMLNNSFEYAVDT